MGCELKTSRDSFKVGDGEDIRPRFLISPDGKNFVPIIDLNDSDYMAQSEIDYWERRLGVSIPPPSQIN
jgi:hypothetical protein